MTQSLSRNNTNRRTAGAMARVVGLAATGLRPSVAITCTAPSHRRRSSVAGPAFGPAAISAPASPLAAGSDRGVYKNRHDG